MKFQRLLFFALCVANVGCAPVRFAGEFRTQYGSIRSDGKTITLIADYRNQK